MYSVHDIANWFLANLDEISNKKLNKLVYYAYSWYLVFFNEDMEDLYERFFPNRFEAWVHGAVYPELYYKYRDYGADPIPKYTGALKRFSAESLDVLEQICDVYGRYTGDELESICCQESPWITARGDLSPYAASHSLIQDKDIFVCYASRL